MIDKEKEKIYDRDLENFINYTNENNEDYKKHGLKLIRKKDLKKTIGLGICIFFGLLTLSAVIFYIGIEGKLSPSVSCNETFICEGDILTCPTQSCPACPNNPCTCNCKMPDEIEIIFKNETE